ncbi:MAG: xanthine dehydrogenase family protein subunit M [Deltaproteobacteria bacterium]|nr:xanthine dehydrogenase family protein subunit M [Deltaproteobacteria bacterium]MBW2077374.1 xanthine dehydrogenase family protein subunit M [Deltaproteobacteria bacterium]MBW2310564.1 xanthine dehydrogenase family protein subunit M [Deltaproteobacteria bacterium]
MMILPEFDYVSFANLRETLDFLSRYGDESKVIAGGTDLMLKLRAGEMRARYMVNLLDIAELRTIESNGDRIIIGPTATHAELASCPLLSRFAPVLSRGASVIGSPQIRNQGTIGGNIGNASPAADTIPALMVLNARVKIMSKSRERWVPVSDFFVSPHETILAKDELIGEIEVKKLPEDTLFSFQRVTRRKAMDIAQMSVAVLLFMDRKRECIREARIAPGSVTPTPVRIREAEEILEGEKVTDAIIEAAAEEVPNRAIDETDLQWMPEYKKPALKGLVISTISEALEKRG